MIHNNMPQAKQDAYAGLTDHEVLLRSQKEPDAFVELVARYEEAFLRKARTILRRQEDAEEVVQDTFTRIYLYADRFVPQEGASFSSWGYAILTRLAFTRYQKVKKEQGRTLVLEPEHYERLPDTEGFLEELDARNEVLLVLSKLPEQAARLLRLQFLEGKTHEEMAEIEGVSVSAIKTRVHRAKRAAQKLHEH